MRLRRRKNWQNELPNSFIPGQFVNPGESTGSSGHDGPGDLRRYRCEGRYLCGGSRNRRYPDRSRRISEIEKRKTWRSWLLSRSRRQFFQKEFRERIKVQGIGAGFVPEILNTNVYDEIIAVSDEDAFATGKMIGQREGILVGISSGAAVWAAIELAKAQRE